MRMGATNHAAVYDSIPAGTRVLDDQQNNA